MARRGGGGGPPFVEVSALLSVATAHSTDTNPQDTAAFLRGKAFMAGVRDDTPIQAACDVYLALEVDGVPKEQIDKWRGRMDRQVVKTQPVDRDSWGLDPRQLAASQKLMGRSVG